MKKKLYLVVRCEFMDFEGGNDVAVAAYGSEAPARAHVIRIQAAAIDGPIPKHLDPGADQERWDNIRYHVAEVDLLDAVPNANEVGGG